MTLLSTAFPSKPIENPALFVSEVIAWLRGTEYSKVLSCESTQDLAGEFVHLRSPAGEELRLWELREGNEWRAIGFRHDFPDDQGRLWRTEGVLQRSAAEHHQALVRFRSQCLARAPGARLEVPRKPYIIKSLLKNEWGGTDGDLAVSDRPLWLKNNDRSLATAESVANGQATRWLPCVYVSATGTGLWMVSKDEIEKLAYDLGGLAHVVVEPNRAFSFRLRDRTRGRNAYGGAFGLSVPGTGFLRRYALGWQIRDKDDLLQVVRTAAAAFHVQVPANAWDWTDLQERALRAQRDALEGSLSQEDADALFDGYVNELEALRQQNLNLLEQLKNRPPAQDNAEGSEGLSGESLARLLGPEIYPGEISDRLRLMAQICLRFADQEGLDPRSREICRRIAERVSASSALPALK